MKARLLKVTVSTYEVEEDGDFTIKTKVKKEFLEKKKPLMDSTIEYEAIRFKNWLDQAKATARYNALYGNINSESLEYWVENKEKKEKKVKETPPTPPVKTGETNPEPEKKTIAQIREAYEKVIGKKPFHGWSIEELEAKIKDHK